MLLQKKWCAISNPVNATFGQYYDDYTADVWIEDYEDPFIVVSDIEVLEPLDSEDTWYAVFHVEMVGGSGSETSAVTWTTMVGEGDTATSGGDFTASSGTVTAGDPDNDKIVVPLVYDGTGESDETFRVSLTGASGGITIMVAEAVATLYDAFALTPDGAPPGTQPDGQHGPVVGRTVTALASDKGDEFWEGDTVTFTPTYSSPTPAPTESIVWHRRPLKSISAIGTKKYGDWEAITSPYTFSQPFIGEVRVTLTSGDTVSHQSIQVRAKAAYPINLRVTSSGQVADHLEVHYAWDSSLGPGREADLDGVTVREFFWLSSWGYYLGLSLAAHGIELDYVFKQPPFYYRHDDGDYWPPGGLPGTLLGMVDKHGEGIELSGTRAFGRETFKQYYLFEVSDGVNYWNVESSSDWGEHGVTTKLRGDPVGKIPFGGNRAIEHKVYRQGENWLYSITKPGDATPIVIDIPDFGRWVAQ